MLCEERKGGDSEDGEEENTVRKMTKSTTMSGAIGTKKRKSTKRLRPTVPPAMTAFLGRTVMMAQPRIRSLSLPTSSTQSRTAGTPMGFPS